MATWARIGVCLNDSPADEAVLVFAAHIAKVYGSQVYCLHVLNESPGGDPVSLSMEAFRSRVERVLPDDVFARTTCHMEDGGGLVEALKFVKDQSLDLVLVGRRLPSNQLRVGPSFLRLVRKSPCSVLAVPEQCKPHFGRVLVAVDCSPHSEHSMKTGVGLARGSGEPKSQLLALNVRSVEPRPDLAGVSFKEAAAEHMQRGSRQLEQFLGRIDAQGIAVEPLVVLSDEPARAIFEVAVARKMDMIVIGSRGPTRPTIAILGSTSEAIVKHSALPVLVVKEKGETVGLLEALFSMG